MPWQTVQNSHDHKYSSLATLKKGERHYNIYKKKTRQQTFNFISIVTQNIHSPKYCTSNLMSDRLHLTFFSSFLIYVVDTTSPQLPHCHLTSQAQLCIMHPTHPTSCCSTGWTVKICTIHKLAQSMTPYEWYFLSCISNFVWSFWSSFNFKIFFNFKDLKQWDFLLLSLINSAVTILERTTGE